MIPIRGVHVKRPERARHRHEENCRFYVVLHRVHRIGCISSMLYCRERSVRGAWLKTFNILTLTLFTTTILKVLLIHFHHYIGGHVGCADREPGRRSSWLSGYARDHIRGTYVHAIHISLSLVKESHL